MKRLNIIVGLILVISITHSTPAYCTQIHLYEDVSVLSAKEICSLEESVRVEKVEKTGRFCDVSNHSGYSKQVKVDYHCSLSSAPPRASP